MTAVVMPPPPAGRAPHRRPRPRVALYSHDTQGLGHIRRNLAVAGALVRRDPRPDVLLVSGAQQARAFPLPEGVDAVTLPALGKDADGRYGPRSLSVALPDVVELRARTIDSALDVFDPDVLVVDKVARGAFDELEPALSRLTARGRARVVLGLRDVLDDAATARREWRETRTDEALRRWYDAVWVYGDPRVADPVTDCGLPADVAALVRYTGYLAPLAASLEARPGALLDLVDEPFVLCCVGGGQDGFPVAEAFLAAAPPAGHRAVVVTGPYLPEAERRRLEARADGRRIVLGAVEDCRPLLARAAAVVTMGGYNTTVELLAARRPALVVPRVRPRLEQRVRAERLSALGLIDVCAPDDLRADDLTTWLAAAVLAPVPCPAAGDVVDLAGLGRIRDLFDELVTERSNRAAC